MAYVWPIQTQVRTFFVDPFLHPRVQEHSKKINLPINLPFVNTDSKQAMIRGHPTLHEPNPYLKGPKCRLIGDMDMYVSSLEGSLKENSSNRGVKIKILNPKPKVWFKCFSFSNQVIFRCKSRSFSRVCTIFVVSPSPRSKTEVTLSKSRAVNHQDMLTERLQRAPQRIASKKNTCNWDRLGTVWKWKGNAR